MAYRYGACGEEGRDNSRTPNVIIISKGSGENKKKCVGLGRIEHDNVMEKCGSETGVQWRFIGVS